MKFAGLLSSLIPLVACTDPEGWIREVNFDLEKISLLYPT